MTQQPLPPWSSLHDNNKDLRHANSLDETSSLSPDHRRRRREQEQRSPRRWSSENLAHLAQQHAAATEAFTSHDRALSRHAVKERRNPIRRWKSAATNIVRGLNVGQWIDNLERDQELADQLEVANQEFQQEVAHRNLVANVKEECMNAVRVHLQDFLRMRCSELEQTNNTNDNSNTNNNDPNTYYIFYKEWIAELHPDNYNPTTDRIDPRFYVQDSDHRLLWNEYVESMRVGGDDDNNDAETKGTKNETSNNPTTSPRTQPRISLDFVPSRGITK